MRRLARMGALLLACTLTCGMAMAQTQADAAVPAQDGKPGMRALLHDPKDGRLAMPRWLLDRKGFLPAPIIVSDPAVGYGGGLALMFFHRPAGAGALIGFLGPAASGAATTISAKRRARSRKAPACATRSPACPASTPASITRGAPKTRRSTCRSAAPGAEGASLSARFRLALFRATVAVAITLTVPRSARLARILTHG